jgi:hypothetical protein
MSVTYEEILGLFREVAEAQKETERKFQDTDRKFQDTDRKFQDTDRLIKALSKNLGDIGNRLGEFVEHMVMPTVVRLFQAQGLEVHEVHPDISVKRDGRGIQIDLLVVNDGVAIAVECKSKMTIDYVDEHVQRMDKLKQMLPAYRHHRVLGAVAALVMPDEVAEYAEEQGFYVLVQSGETLTIGNQPAFCARAW